MGGHAEESVQRVIDSIHQNISEPITIDDMARTAMFSKFHFTRIFQRATGVSPGRFLSAVRLQEAKRLLLSTSLSVTEISHKVGYSSVGTFSSRFKSSVGLSPTAYRQLRGFAPSIPVDTHRSSAHSMSIHGEVFQQDDGDGDGDGAEGTIFIGLFPDTIPQGRPARCTVLGGPGPFRLDNVPEGDWYLLAQSVVPGEEYVIGETPPTVAVHGPLTVRHGHLLRPVRIGLRPMRTLDPPVLLALLDTRRVALSATAS
ncbi:MULTISPECIES: AraC family transcriptional regulator [Actinomadura]|uniref:AraC family transcriptional regulator n=1 Tax=Actinomadura miaoliensis TaxID=430685 RepID=A0ABP7WMR1_9ACTN